MWEFLDTRLRSSCPKHHKQMLPEKRILGRSDRMLENGSPHWWKLSENSPSKNPQSQLIPPSAQFITRSLPSSSPPADSLATSSMTSLMCWSPSSRPHVSTEEKPSSWWPTSTTAGSRSMSRFYDGFRITKSSIWIETAGCIAFDMFISVSWATRSWAWILPSLQMATPW